MRRLTKAEATALLDAALSAQAAGTEDQTYQIILSSDGVKAADQWATALGRAIVKLKDHLAGAA